MLFGQDRQQMREFFIAAWRKHRAGEPLQPLETLLADVIGEHPEYHRHLQHRDGAARDFQPQHGEDNPFMHMGLHIALREQLAAGRPAGVGEIHRTLSRRRGVHDAEHRMIEALAETLWESGHSGQPPDEAQYLQRLRRLL